MSCGSSMAANAGQFAWMSDTKRMRIPVLGAVLRKRRMTNCPRTNEIVGSTGTFDRNAHARIGEALFYGFFGMLLSVTLLVAPGATAGAVCLDKARGTLLHLLVTDLSSAEIVLGKLAARLLPLLGL